ncbi:hypothetical protein BT63DRAFT_460610 [Microthyrium microscopicum]|uniref:Uncharacterized protein n=1 Tax=Microthyrium microscopicum TaxID=703497 RepID=A0A6A6TXZ2_9PEZI|nr:hypothetical protein BT63DRAFT_460610 [Microthyrium microscopicum]
MVFAQSSLTSQAALSVGHYASRVSKKTAPLPTPSNTATPSPPMSTTKLTTKPTPQKRARRSKETDAATKNSLTPANLVTSPVKTDATANPSRKRALPIDATGDQVWGSSEPSAKKTKKVQDPAPITTYGQHQNAITEVAEPAAIKPISDDTDRIVLLMSAADFPQPKEVANNAVQPTSTEPAQDNNNTTTPSKKKRGQADDFDYGAVTPAPKKVKITITVKATEVSGTAPAGTLPVYYRHPDFDRSGVIVGSQQYHPNKLRLPEYADQIQPTLKTKIREAHSKRVPPKSSWITYPKECIEWAIQCNLRIAQDAGENIEGLTVAHCLALLAEDYCKAHRVIVRPGGRNSTPNFFPDSDVKWTWAAIDKIGTTPNDENEDDVQDDASGSKEPKEESKAKNASRSEKEKTQYYWRPVVYDYLAQASGYTALREIQPNLANLIKMEKALDSPYIGTDRALVELLPVSTKQQTESDTNITNFGAKKINSRYRQYLRNKSIVEAWDRMMKARKLAAGDSDSDYSDDHFESDESDVDAEDTRMEKNQKMVPVELELETSSHHLASGQPQLNSEDSGCESDY